MMNKFNAIILAAGKGTRLLPLTKDCPKCLVKVKGKSILDRQLELFDYVGIKTKIVVSGYLNEKIDKENYINIVNKDYDISNMLHSLMLARKFLNGNVIISYGDILYKKKVLNSLLEDPRDIVIASDNKWKNYWNERFNNPLDDAESFVKGENQRVKSLGKTETNIKNIEGQFIGLIKLSARGCADIISVYDDCYKSNSCSLNAWGSQRKLKLAYMTDILNFIASDNKLYFREIERGWIEVDNLIDLEIANKVSWL